MNWWSIACASGSSRPACCAGAVEQVNRAAGATRAIFVDSSLDETNAAYAPQSLLWELDLNEPNQAPDEVAAERLAACVLVGAGDLQKQQCLLSAVGHPNVAGAAKMAQECMAALTRSFPAAV